MGMASSYDITKEPFDPDTAIKGQAFTSEDLKRYANRSRGFKNSFIRFVCMYQDDPIFEFWDYNRYENGLPKGGVSQHFSLFGTSGLVRDPENDWEEYEETEEAD